ncbi:Ubiquitin carboxyl-terminal hydrolase 36 [Aphanomyces cochlioides]|nr:Ubiquitin carboxyl-terminal hydrolase 36 [Aphanomyces cochlioides]
MLATGTTVQLKTAMQLVKERRIDFRRAQRPENAGTAPVKGSVKTANTSKTTAASSSSLTDEIRALVLWTQPRKIGPGLMNLGNTCYLNSVLQCLAYSPAFAQYLVSRPASATSKTQQGFHAERSMTRLLAQIHSPTTPRVIQPREIVMSLKQIAKGFRIGRQEDSHEFFRHLMEAMHKSTAKQKTNDTSTLVHAVFGGTLRSHVRCPKCKFISERIEPFLDLSLEVSSGISSVPAALGHFTAVETLDAENAWKCGGCSQRTRASKGLNVHDVPNALVLHLKRFDGFYGKLKKHIEFAETLNLNQGKILTKPIADASYSLTAVLVHAGASPDCGHYYAFVKSPAGTWHEMNDETVRVVNINTVLQQRAYMLFYTRKTAKPFKPVVAPKAEVTAPLPVQQEVRKPVPPIPANIDQGETSQESFSDEGSEESQKIVDAEPVEKETSKVVKAWTFGPIFTGSLHRYRRFRTAWKRYQTTSVVVTAKTKKLTAAATPAPLVVKKAGFVPHRKFQNSLLSADVPQWRDEDEDVSAELQKEHNQKVRQLNSELWQAKRSKQLDYWDQTLDQGKLKKIKKRKEFVANEGRMNQFQRALDAKKAKRH